MEKREASAVNRGSTARFDGVFFQIGIKSRNIARLFAGNAKDSRLKT